MKASDISLRPPAADPAQIIMARIIQKTSLEILIPLAAWWLWREPRLIGSMRGGLYI